jgi:large subunit ribosomal protein L1
MKRSKGYTDKKAGLEPGKQYEFEEGVELIKSLATAKFDETIEIHLRLGVDSRHADQQVRGAIVLPNGTGKSMRVLVFAKGDKVKEAQDAGADFVGADEYVDKITKEGWLEFDAVIASPDMMGVVGKLGRVLGPRGLMPNPKTGTVTNEIGQAVKDAKAGKIEYRLDKTNIIHCPIGRKSFSNEALLENMTTLLDAVKKAKPAAAKGQYFRSVAIASTMSPAIKLSTAKL